MKKNKDKNFFWISYADLMTTLFFVMLVLYVLTFIKLKLEQQTYKVKAKAFDEIKKIEESINNIDNNYFRYSPKYKKHILNINVSFRSSSDNIGDIDRKTRKKLIQAGKSIRKFMSSANKYLLIIEGQASNYGDENFNYELSYKRALALIRFWESRNINISNLKNCELIIAGSGERGVPRDSVKEKNNQRFLIHILPKTGKMDLENNISN